MHISQSFTLLIITASFLLIADRIKAEKTTFGCRGKFFYKNLRSQKFNKIRHNLNDITLPERFDPREKWTYCKSLNYITHQGRCGGCWAFAASSVMSDRMCIATRGKFNKILSVQELLECCNYCTRELQDVIGGCAGGTSAEAFRYWEEYGIVTGYQGCKPIEESALKGMPQMACRHRCTNESYKVEYEKDRTFSVKTLLTYPVQEGDIKHIMAELMLNGPVTGMIQIFEYNVNEWPEQATILKFNKSLAEGQTAFGHAIKIIGWDNINGTPVWIMANSWGEHWCDKGFCYIRRGQNDFYVETIFYAGIPKILKGTKKPKQIEKTETSGSNIIKITNPIELVILCILTM